MKICQCECGNKESIASSYDLSDYECGECGKFGKWKEVKKWKGIKKVTKFWSKRIMESKNFKSYNICIDSDNKEQIGDFIKRF